jgi:hypothetical protein
VFGGDGALEDTNPLGILIKHCLDILGLPKRILKYQDIRMDVT